MQIEISDDELIRMAGMHPSQSVVTAVNYLMHGGNGISRQISREALKERLLDLLERTSKKVKPRQRRPR